MNTMPYSHKGELIALIERMKEKGGKVDSVLDSIKEAQTFRLPHQESLPTVKDYKLFYEFMKAPYEIFLIEMPTDNGWLIMYISCYQNMHESTKEMNAAIAEYNEGLRKKWWQLTRKKDAEKDMIDCDLPSFSCALFFKDKENGWNSWTHFDVEMDETGFEVKSKDDDLGKDEVRFSDDHFRRFAWTIFEFMVAVNTPNIKQLEVKAPKLINAKRAKKGKPLLEGYRYLDLVPREQLSHDGTGTGTTKRMHWRRGHIRRLPDRTTWVRPALIGKEGFIDKTYRLPDKHQRINNHEE